jgi:DNA-directed RNA polymerase specialized sigma24 family protein
VINDVTSGETARQRLADAGLRRALAAMIRRRVPPHEVDEIVQATLADACASSTAPSDDEALERWVRGIARHKVADYHRRARREVPVEAESLSSSRVSDASAHDAADLLRWAERESDRDHTLDWLLREGDGEKLESIAEQAQLPAARVRQRVSRLRRHFRARWAAQVAAALVVGVLVFSVIRLRERAPRVEPVIEASTAPSVVVPPPTASATPPPPVDPAIELRRVALEQCAAKQWSLCLAGLDDAAKLDPAGDSTDAVQTARRAAKAALMPRPKVVDGVKKTKTVDKAAPLDSYPNAAF